MYLDCQDARLDGRGKYREKHNLEASDFFFV